MIAIPVLGLLLASEEVISATVIFFWPGLLLALKLGGSSSAPPPADKINCHSILKTQLQASRRCVALCQLQTGRQRRVLGSRGRRRSYRVCVFLLQ